MNSLLWEYALKAVPTPTNITFFTSPAEFRDWLKQHHTTEIELWIGFYKKESGKSGITYREALDEALCFGWIDGIVKSVDGVSYTQRFTPRKARSSWSKINREHIKRLTKLGKMMPAGLEQVLLAKKDGRWKLAYDSPSTMTVPADFLRAVKKDKKAYACFKTLNRSNLYAIGYRLQTAKTPETRSRRLKALLAALAMGKSIL